MADFHQEGIITTLHALYEAFDTEAYLNDLEIKLEEYSKHVKMSLLLPSLYSEIQNPQVLDRILDEIQKVNYIHSIVIALGGAQEEAQFKEAKEYFGRYFKRFKSARSRPEFRERASQYGLHLVILLPGKKPMSSRFMIATSSPMIGFSWEGWSNPQPIPTVILNFAKVFTRGFLPRNVP
jgi:hypothetical protein